MEKRRNDTIVEALRLFGLGFHLEEGSIKYVTYVTCTYFQCLGRKFAESQILLVTSTILHNLDITSVDGESVPPLPDKPASDKFGFGVPTPGNWMVRIKYRK